MPIYNMKNTKTDEVVEMNISISKMESLKQTGEWITVPVSPRIVSESGDIVGKMSSGWNDQLNRIKEGSGRSNTIKTK